MKLDLTNCESDGMIQVYQLHGDYNVVAELEDGMQILRDRERLELFEDVIPHVLMKLHGALQASYGYDRVKLISESIDVLTLAWGCNVGIPGDDD